jgi:hypothetical protein
MLKDLQKQLKKVNNELYLARQYDAPEADIAALKEQMGKITHQMMKICRGEY